MSRAPPIQFVDSVAALPSTAPRNHAHIIDLTIKKVPKNIMLQDAVVTVLHQTSTLVIDMFLAATKRFQMGYIPKSENTDDCLVIMRRGSEVLVGQYSRLKSPVVLQFDNTIRFSVSSDGAWRVTNATYLDYFVPNWDDVWAGKTTELGFKDNNFKTTNDDFAMREILAMQAADHILARKFWDDKTFIWTRSKD